LTPDFSAPFLARLKPLKSRQALAENYYVRSTTCLPDQEALDMLRVSLAALMLSTGIMFSLPNTASAAADEPGWLGVVVARGELKQWIDSTPIVERPNRPFHFYGNAVRRQYYRGNAVPRPDDLAKGGAALIKRPPNAAQ